MNQRIVFITGSASGIGEQTAYQFARAGCRLILTYHTSESDGHRVEEECRRLGAGETLLLKLDLTDDLKVQNAVEEIIKKFGHLDILINNAGALSQKPLLDKTFEDITMQIKTNLEGPIKLTKLCLPYLKEAIVNVGSRLGFIGRKNLTVYCATKFGIRGFTKALAQEYPLLRVACVNPGLTATRMGDNAGVKASKVAEIIYGVAIGAIRFTQGGDLNVYEYLENPVVRLLKKLWK